MRNVLLFLTSGLCCEHNLRLWSKKMDAYCEGSTAFVCFKSFTQQPLKRVKTGLYINSQ